MIDQRNVCATEIYILWGAFKFALGVIHSELSQTVVYWSEWIVFGDTVGIKW